MVTPTLAFHYHPAVDKSDDERIAGINIPTTRSSTTTYFDAAGVLQTAGANVTAYDHDPATGESLGRLIWPALTNLCLRSEELDSGTWLKTNTSVTANEAVFVNGETVADALVENTSDAGHTVSQAGLSFTSGTTYTLSAFVKARERDRIRLELGTGAFPNNSYADFDVTTGSTPETGAGIDSSLIEPINNGWYRCSVTSTADVTTTTTVIARMHNGSSIIYLGDGVSGIRLCGFSLVTGTVAGPYTATEGSQVTRAADSSLFNDVSWVNTDEGVFYIKAIQADVTLSTNRGGFVVSDGTTNNRHQINSNAANDSVQAAIVTGGGVQFATTDPTAWTNNTIHQAAYYYETDSARFCRDGVLQAEDTLVTPPTALTQGELGILLGAQTWAGWFLEVRYYNAKDFQGTGDADASQQALTNGEIDEEPGTTAEQPAYGNLEWLAVELLQWQQESERRRRRMKQAETPAEFEIARDEYNAAQEYIAELRRLEAQMTGSPVWPELYTRNALSPKLNTRRNKAIRTDRMGPIERIEAEANATKASAIRRNVTNPGNSLTPARSRNKLFR